MRFTPIFGWILLMIGISIIFWTLYSSYNIFTGKEKIPEIFQTEAQKFEITNKPKTGPSQSEPQKEIEKIIEDQLKKMLPVNFLPRLLNLICWSILAGILIFGGSQISSLGIKMIKS